MQLYYAPMACSLAARITAAEAGHALEFRRIDLATKAVAGGGDLHAVNPMGQVPTLVLDDGRVLTEAIAVMLYLWGRSDPQVVRWLAFVATELHKRVCLPIFAYDSPPAIRDWGRAGAARPLGYLDAHLADRACLTGDEFTPADAYAVWALSILPFGHVPLPANLAAYCARHQERRSVAAAFALERAEYMAKASATGAS